MPKFGVWSNSFVSVLRLLSHSSTAYSEEGKRLCRRCRSHELREESVGIVSIYKKKKKKKKISTECRSFILKGFFLKI